MVCRQVVEQILSAEGVGDQVPFAALDFLAGVDTAVGSVLRPCARRLLSRNRSWICSR
jgi:hypothetical protein